MFSSQVPTEKICSSSRLKFSFGVVMLLLALSR